MQVKYACILRDNLSWDFLKDFFFRWLSEGALQRIVYVQKIAENKIALVSKPFGTWLPLCTTEAITEHNAP